MLYQLDNLIEALKNKSYSIDELKDGMSTRKSITTIIIKALGALVLIVSCWLLYMFLGGGIELTLISSILIFMILLLTIAGLILIFF